MEEKSEEDIPFVELFGFDISLKPGKPRPLEMCKPDSNEDGIKQKLISEWISASCEDLTALSGVPLDTWDYDEEMKKIETIERSLNEDLDSIEYYPVKNFNLESENTESRSVGNEFSINSYEASGDSKAIQKQEFPKENKKKTKKLRKKGLKKRQSVPSIDKQDVDIIEYPVKNIILEEEDSRKLVIERIRVKKMFEEKTKICMDH
ncbi:uncharacterized protein LOC123674044 isoform X2 [Harmonia axyridis]|uniref:uncharacterized protein LOC123674044 isoform X2 n=1 Tax=Harmonia axyridis TaxID=115357 RepID=UPI001E2774AD|nr:uncharacterized protein LOC123674044 isoform X2 [Harmonia axyridis]